MKFYFILLLSFISCYAMNERFSEIEKQLKSLETSQQISEQWVSKLQIIQSTLTTLSKENNFALKKYRFEQTNDPTNEYSSITENSQKIVLLQEKLFLLISSRKTLISAYNKKSN